MHTTDATVLVNVRTCVYPDFICSIVCQSVSQIFCWWFVLSRKPQVPSFFGLALWWSGPLGSVDKIPDTPLVLLCAKIPPSLFSVLQTFGVLRESRTSVRARSLSEQYDLCACQKACM